jgi:hypothetical protein
MDFEVRRSLVCAARLSCTLAVFKPLFCRAFLCILHFNSYNAFPHALFICHCSARGDYSHDGVVLTVSDSILQLIDADSIEKHIRANGTPATFIQPGYYMINFTNLQLLRKGKVGW